MKSLKLFGMMMLFASILLMSCGKEEDKGSCSDGIKNQDETDIDCGGVCTACLVGAQGKWKSLSLQNLKLTTPIPWTNGKVGLKSSLPERMFRQNQMWVIFTP